MRGGAVPCGGGAVGESSCVLMLLPAAALFMASTLHFSITCLCNH